MNNKVLIVDDSETDLTYLKQIVDNEHFVTVTARSGDEAIAKARSEHPSLIFMDIIMGDRDGFSTCREMKNDPELNGIPVVFVSSKNQRADHMWASRQGARGLISKPYDEAQIIEQLRAS